MTSYFYSKKVLIHLAPFYGDDCLTIELNILMNAKTEVRNSGFD